MKKTFAIWFALCLMCAGSAFAAVPQQLNYQGYLTNTGGNALDTTVAMTFKLYTDSLAGSLLWTETRPSVSVAKGLFNVRLGQLAALDDNVLNNAQVWLGVTVGNNSEMMPRSRIVSVGYSYRVGTVDGASGGTITTDVNIQNRLNVGSGNINSGDFAFVAGENNTASGDHAAVSGGAMNQASGRFAFLGAGYGNLADGSSSTVGGGYDARAVGDNSVCAGGAYTRANGFSSVVGGGGNNTASGSYATVGGGGNNTASGDYYATIGGGYQNVASGEAATVGGGGNNTASGEVATVGGGSSDTASGRYATIGGGYQNVATDDYATVAGGMVNRSESLYGFVGGGYGNVVPTYGTWSAVLGGSQNRAEGVLSVVCNGDSNVARGQGTGIVAGTHNQAESAWSFVGGGFYNTASGGYATVPGGEANTASGNYSFAAGRRAKALHTGSFVWGDATDADFSSDAGNQFNVRASGGVRIATTTAGNVGVKLDNGDTAWEVLSDSTKKTNRRAANTQEILAKVAQLRIEEWNYKHQDSRNTHIGPMAQEFYRLFGYGDDATSISTIDPDGIALAAIQELQKQNAELKAQNNSLEKQVAEIKIQLQQLANQKSRTTEQASLIDRNH